MPTKSQRRKKRKAQQSCKCETESIKSDVRSASSTCDACRKAGRSITVLLPAGKRKREASDIIPDSETSEINPPISTKLSQTLNSTPPYSPAKKCRTSNLSVSRPLESSQKSTPTVQSKPYEACGICTNRDERRAWMNKMGGEKTKWFQCEMKACKMWYHSSCVFVLLDQDPQSMLFCPGPSNNRAILVCPNCIGQPEKGYDKAVQLAMKAFMSTYETQKKKDNENKSSMGRPAHIMAVLDEIDFELPREERYHGFDDNLVNRLMRKLHQSILDYDIEIQSSIDRSRATSKIPTQVPLATWHLVDGHSSVVSGQPWFDIDEVVGKQPQRHASITTALRAILGIHKEDPLKVPSKLASLTYSQVHTGLVSWFAFDVIENRFDMYRLPNMISMRAMMTATANAGEARWPGQGRRLLQEVQLRTWYKSEFQQALLSNVERLKQSMEAFLNPLTKEFHKIDAWSDARRNIIEDTLQLWSYLLALQGKLVLIHPAIEDSFDSKRHEAYDQEGLQLSLGKNSKRKILWVLCRGFQYQEEDGMEDARVLTIKARVIVQ